MISNFFPQVLTPRTKGSDLVEQVANLLRSVPDRTIFAATEEIWNPFSASSRHSSN